jgi:hypothetical protein
MPGVVLDRGARVDEERVRFGDRLDEGDLDRLALARRVLAERQLALGVDPDDTHLLGDVPTGDAAFARVATRLVGDPKLWLRNGHSMTLAFSSSSSCS